MRARWSFLLLLALLVPRDGWAIKRFALLVGANTGWEQDRTLRYAEDDARNLGAVLSELGGFAPGDRVFLSSPTTERLLAELHSLQQRLREEPAQETLFLFYYSGHADARYLHLAGAPLSFENLYQRLRKMGAGVTLGILDACQSGSILKVKGGRAAPAFRITVQNEGEVRGTVILTSSGADELSQEARALSGSFFTQHLVSGLRGAADENGDLQISLDEAYRHSATRTLLDTAGTLAGEQRPGFRYELKGHGNLYLTRLEGPVGFLLFPPGSPRCFVTDTDERRLVAEVGARKEAGQRLGIPPGAYRLKCVDGGKYRVASLELKAGEWLESSQLTFREAPLSGGVLKGAGRSPELVEALAHRLAAQSELIRTERPEQLELSVLLAVTSLRLAPSLEAQQVLRLGLERLPRSGACMKHTGAVLGVAWSPEGQQLATSSADGRVHLWAAETGAALSHLTPPSRVTELAWSVDGQLLSARRPQGEAFLWARGRGDGFVRQLRGLPLRAIVFAPSGQHLALIDRKDNLSLATSASGDSLLSAGANSSLARFSADGRFLASFDIFGRARVWNLATGKLALVVEAETPSTRASTLALSPDGRLLALVSQGAAAVRIWDVPGARQLSLVRHEGAVSALAFTPDGLLISASEDKSVRVWEVATGREQVRLPHEAAVESLALSPDGKWLVTTQLGGRSALLWNMETGQGAAWLAHGGAVNAVSWSPEGDRLATASADGMACIWGLAGATVARASAWGLHTGMAFSPDGGALFTATEGDSVHAWDVVSGRERAPRVQTGGVHHLALSPDGRLLATTEGHRAQVWEVGSGRELARVEHEGFIHALAFSPEGRWVASASQDGTVRVWEAATGHEQMRGRHEGAVSAVAFSPEGQRLATGGEDQTARLWDVATGLALARWVHKDVPCEEVLGKARGACERARMWGTAAKLESVSFSPDGKLLATTTLDGVARVWDIGSARERLLLRHPEFIRTLAFSPDGRALAIASGEPGARLWSVATGEELSRIATVEDVSFLQYSVDGKSLMTSSAAGTIHLWEPDSGRELARIQEDSRPEAVLLSPDGRYVATAKDDGEAGGVSYSLQVWRSEDLVEQACARLRRNLSRAEWRKYGGSGEAYPKVCPSLPGE
ncbi:caspase family protein [Hyalangium sp.]|uniref:WD40 domain-containing protein n=1 Tax=Hyalangium sp. TaxID=2028555 RepID=UPI002D4B3FA1|nr:caspase family protein [Hyalangium sp.]HYH95379.1 caspase family protein [Hyalangium sp.]